MSARHLVRRGWWMTHNAGSRRSVAVPRGIPRLGDTETSPMQDLSCVVHSPRRWSVRFSLSRNGDPLRLGWEDRAWTTLGFRWKRKVEAGPSAKRSLAACVLLHLGQEAGELYFTHLSSICACCRSCVRCRVEGTLRISRCRVRRGPLHIMALDKMRLHSSARLH